jgi:hypothetical protein
MTWAARRKTTRVEDMAYSLMIIFDLSLHWQIACGETGDQMLGRPIEVIMQASGPSVLNWKGEVQGIQPHQLFRNHRETPWATERLYGVIRNWR